MLTSEEKRKIITKFQKHQNDTGSSAVQIEIMRAKIEALKPHFQVHKKDLHSKRGLIEIVNKLRRITKYATRKQQAAIKK